jgi:lysophospholipase L1-like esterase
MSELFYYADELIVQYKPKKIFIYEGDNDLSKGKSPDQILLDAEKLLKLIRCGLPRKVKVFFITPKPSILRWDQRNKYETYINMLKVWSGKQKNVEIVDVWTPMLDEKGELQKDLFIEDGLHMNSKGYDLWSIQIKRYLQ